MKTREKHSLVGWEVSILEFYDFTMKTCNNSETTKQFDVTHLNTSHTYSNNCKNGEMLLKELLYLCQASLKKKKHQLFCLECTTRAYDMLGISKKYFSSD